MDTIFINTSTVRKYIFLLYISSPLHFADKIQNLIPLYLYATSSITLQPQII